MCEPIAFLHKLVVLNHFMHFVLASMCCIDSSDRVIYD